MTSFGQLHVAQRTPWLKAEEFIARMVCFMTLVANSLAIHFSFCSLYMCSLICNSSFFTDCIYGIPGSSAEAAAREADDNVDSLVDILLEFRSLNDHHNRKPPIICIENPDGYLPKHPLSERFIEVLGLTKLKISYCKFASEESPLPRKDTVLWTNSPSLIAAFEDETFSCKSDCKCMANGRHRVGVQDYADRCAAYPTPMVDFVSKMIADDVRKMKNGNI